MAGHAVEHPRLLPAVLVPDPDGEAAATPRRSTRDWIVDASAFVLALAFGGLFWGAEVATTDHDRWLILDGVYGLLVCCALWLRRRHPVALGLAAIPATLSTAAGGAATIALFTLAVHRRWPAAVAVGVVQLALTPLYLELHPQEDDMPSWAFMIIVVCITAAVVAWGMFVRARRQLVLSLRERARRAESEQQLRVDQARQAERARIAREMHDVLAHRISLVSLHAGALEFRPDAPGDEVARAAGVIRASAHQALADLREVIGVLRDGDGFATVPEPPQPTLAELPGVLAESRAAGMRVREDLRVDDLAAVPASTGRSALRIVQEGLTNVRKHAPGASVDVRVSGAPGAGLTVELRNPASLAAPAVPAMPGAGTGLVGLAERASLAGGTLEHGFVDGGEFRLRAWLPWPA